MDYDLQIQLNRLEQKVDELMIELGIIDEKTGDYIPYAERNNVGTDARSGTQLSEETDEEEDKPEENKDTHLCTKCQKVIREAKDLWFNGTNPYHKACFLEESNKNIKEALMMKRNKSLIGGK